jgi:hypothetical protein
VKKNKNRTDQAKVLIALLAIIIAIGFMEGFLQYRSPRNLRLKRGKVPVPYRQIHPVYGHGLRPNSSGVNNTYGEFTVPYRVNSLGLRDREYTKEIPPGTSRIFFVGDSFTEGFSLRLENTFMKILEKRFNQQPAHTGAKYEMVNMGVVSFSPLLQYLFLKEQLKHLNADLIVLNLDPSDFADDYFYEKGTTWAPDGAPLHVKHGNLMPNFLSYGRHYLETLPGRPWRNSYVLRFLTWHLIRRTHSGWINQRIGKIEYDRYGWTRSNPSSGDSWDQQFERSLSYLVRIRNYLKNQGIGFAITVYPNGHMVHPQAWCAGRKRAFYECGKIYNTSLFEKLIARCPEVELTCWDLVPFFRRPDAPSLFYDIDGHFTEKGSTVMADALEIHLRPLLTSR